MPEVKVAQHIWVKMVVTPLEILTNEGGEPIAMVDPDIQRKSEDDARYGCFACDAELTKENFGSECCGE